MDKAMYSPESSPSKYTENKENLKPQNLKFDLSLNMETPKTIKRTYIKSNNTKPCSKCSRQINPYGLRQHEQSCKGNSNQELVPLKFERICKICHQEFTKQSDNIRDYLKHVEYCKKFNKFTLHKGSTCLFCKKKFQRRRGLYVHLQIIHSDQIEADKDLKIEKMNKCSTCNRKFRLSIELNKHKTNCNTRKTTAENNVKTKAETKNPLSNICKYCKSEKSKSAINDHVRNCSKYYSFVEALKHGTYQCRFCAKVFNFRETAYIHLTKFHLDVINLKNEDKSKVNFLK